MEKLNKYDQISAVLKSRPYIDEKSLCTNKNSFSPEQVLNVAPRKAAKRNLIIGRLPFKNVLLDSVENPYKCLFGIAALLNFISLMLLVYYNHIS